MKITKNHITLLKTLYNEEDSLILENNSWRWKWGNKKVSPNLISDLEKDRYLTIHTLPRSKETYVELTSKGYRFMDVREKQKSFRHPVFWMNFSDLIRGESRAIPKRFLSFPQVFFGPRTTVGFKKAWDLGQREAKQYKKDNWPGGMAKVIGVAYSWRGDTPHFRAVLNLGYSHS